METKLEREMRFLKAYAIISPLVGANQPKDDTM